MRQSTQYLRTKVARNRKQATMYKHQLTTEM